MLKGLRSGPVLVLGALVFGLSTSLAAAQQAPSASTPGAEGTVPAVLADYVAAIDAGEAPAVAALYAEDAVVEQAVGGGNTFRGRAAITDWIAANLVAVPDLSIETRGVVQEDDRLAWEWVYRGAYTGRYPGLPAGRGQPIELRGVSVMDLRDGLIARETLYYDNGDFLRQVGAVPDSTPPPTTPMA